MEKTLVGVEGVLCHMDDILVFGHTKDEHDARLEATLQKLHSAGVTLNPSKCQFERTELRFLGHLLTEQGIQPDPEKTAAISNMPPPANVKELRRFMGMINHLGKFSDRLAMLTRPLRELLSKGNSWTWNSAQNTAFNNVKAELTKPRVLTHYNVNADLKISADASSYGLGAVLLQKNGQSWQPVTYASRATTTTECHYAQVEKEALAITWSCEKFSSYILGKKFAIETDHKPLIPLLGNKSLHSLPPRILHFRLRLARFDYVISHVPGKLLVTADTLSRAPLPSVDTQTSLQEEADYLMEACIAALPASSHRLEEFCAAQAADSVCLTLFDYCRNGWPAKHNIPVELRPFWQNRGLLTTHNNLLLCGPRIVIPVTLQREILSKIHDGHQGIQKCRLRANISVWWPGIAKQIKDIVEHCPTCTRASATKKEPLIPSELPEYPWQKLGTDIFFLNGTHYLVVVDYFSKYLEVIKLGTTTSRSVIDGLKAMFSRHGIPETVISDNGPQFSSHEFSVFANSYNFTHTTSSPYYPQSNGQAERTVQTVKHLLTKSEDPYLALLIYRATPLPWCNLSPSQLLMGRHLRTNLPQVQEHLQPKWIYLEEFKQQHANYKQKQKSAYDTRHRVRPLAPIPEDNEVWVTMG